MPLGSGDVDRPLGPFRFSTKVLERWFAGVSLWVGRQSQKFKARVGGGTAEKNLRKAETITAERAEKTFQREVRKRWREWREARD